MDNHECPNDMISCPFAHAGCPAFMQRKELSRHLQKKQETHLNLLNKKLQQKDEIIMTLERKFKKMTTLLKDILNEMHVRAETETLSTETEHEAELSEDDIMLLQEISGKRDENKKLLNNVDNGDDDDDDDDKNLKELSPPQPKCFSMINHNKPKPNQPQPSVLTNAVMPEIINDQSPKRNIPIIVLTDDSDEEPDKNKNPIVQVDFPDQEEEYDPAEDEDDEEDEEDDEEDEEDDDVELMDKAGQGTERNNENEEENWEDVEEID